MANVRGLIWKFAMPLAALGLAGAAEAKKPRPVAPAVVPPAVVLPVVPQQPGSVFNFYAVRQGAPVWFRAAGIGAPEKLAAILRRATVDGLTIAPQLAAEADAAIMAAKSADPATVQAADRRLSTVWVTYVQKLKSPIPGMIYGDPSVRSTAPRPDQILREAANAASLSQHLDQVSAVNPLYSALRDAALKTANPADGVAAGRIAANLDRVRALPADGRFVVVDAAGARLWMYENGKPIDSMKVIVGKLDSPTPMIASMIHYATFNPYWHVPDNLARRIIAGNVLKKGSGYLKERGYQIVSEWSNTATILPADSVDWKGVAAGTVEVKVRQLPGGNNSMGRIKFPFPNGEGIYLHDTPEKALFAKTQRTLSNGCIRLEDARRFAGWLMGSMPQPASSDAEQHVRLPRSVPVFVTYITAQPSGDHVTFINDVYGRDGVPAPGSQVAAALR